MFELILECIFHCHTPYHLFPSVADVFLMNSERLISSLLSFAVGKHFTPGLAPYLRVALDWFRPQLESTSLLVSWQGHKEKHWPGG